MIEKWEAKDRLIKVLSRVDEFDAAKMKELELFCSSILSETRGFSPVVVADRSDREIFERIKSDSWVPAVDPDFMLDLNSEDDKYSRARGIITQFSLDNLSGIKFLDFGCGEGHVSWMMRNVNDIQLSAGYDVDEQWSKVSMHSPDFLSSDLDKVRQFAPYDVILLHDVIDHVRQPIEILKLVRELLHPGGEVKVRVHPWSSRSGAHHYRHWNKAWAHLLLSAEEMESMGCTGLPYTNKVYDPDVYRQWFTETGFRIVTDQEHWEPAGPEPFENDERMKQRMLRNYPGMANINYSKIERTFIDYGLRV